MNKSKYFFSVPIIFFFLSVFILPSFAGVQSYTADSYPNDAVVIKSGAQLEQIGIGSTGHYILANDIDMKGFPSFPMIKDFKGHFDGNGHVIKNLTIINDQAVDAGLFESVSGGAVIQNLGVYQCYMDTPSATVGGLIGRVNYQNDKIQVLNCFTSGSVNGKTAGGLIGSLNGDVEMTVNDVPIANMKNVMIQNCYSTVSVSGSDSSGDLAGIATGGNIVNCYSAPLSHPKGLIGQTTTSPIVDNCYSNGTDNGDDFFKPEFLTKLNNGSGVYKQDTGDSYESLLNRGMPILEWQKPVCSIDVFMEWYIQGEPSDIVNVTMEDPINPDGQITYSVTGPVNIPETTERVPERKFFLRFGNDATNGLDQNGAYTLTVKDTNGNQQSYSIVIEGAAQNSGTAAAPNELTQGLITVTFNGAPIEFDQPPIIQDGRTLVPMRAIFQAMGATVDWDGDTQTITAVRGDVTIVMTIENRDITVNGVVIHLDVSPQIVNDRTLVPVRAVAESLDANVEWIEESQTVVITSKDSSIVNADELINTQLLDTIGKDTAELSLMYGDVTVLSEFDQDNSHYNNIKFANLPFEFSVITIDGKDIICSFNCTYKDLIYVDPSSVSSIDELIAKLPLSLITRDENSIMFQFVNNIFVAIDLTDGKVTNDTIVRVFERIGV